MAKLKMQPLTQGDLDALRVLSDLVEDHGLRPVAEHMRKVADAAEALLKGIGAARPRRIDDEATARALAELVEDVARRTREIDPRRPRRSLYPIRPIWDDGLRWTTGVGDTTIVTTDRVNDGG